MGTHDYNSFEEIRLVFFGDRINDYIRTLNKFMMDVFDARKNEYTSIYDYHIKATQCKHAEMELAWGECIGEKWPTSKDRKILSCEIRSSTDCSVGMWFQNNGIDMIINNAKYDNCLKQHDENQFSVLAKRLNCAIDATYHSYYSGLISESQREIYMNDGRKVFEEETDYDMDNNHDLIMRNKNFGKKSFVDVIVNEYCTSNNKMKRNELS